MIGDSFTVEGKTYKIQKELTFKEYRKNNRVSGKLNELSKEIGKNENITDLPEEQLQKIITEFSSANNEQMDLMAEFLEQHLGMTQDEIDELSLNNAIKIFQEAFKLSTTPDKKLKKT